MRWSLRSKDAASADSSDTGATEDAGSGRPARPGGQRSFCRGLLPSRLDLELDTLVQGKPGSNVEAELALGMLRSGRCNLDEKDAATLVTNQRARAAEGVPELRSELGIAEPDAEPFDGNCTLRFPDPRP